MSTTSTQWTASLSLFASYHRHLHFLFLFPWLNRAFFLEGDDLLMIYCDGFFDLGHESLLYHVYTNFLMVPLFFLLDRHDIAKEWCGYSVNKWKMKLIIALSLRSFLISQITRPSFDDSENLYVLVLPVALGKWVSASHWLDYQLVRYKEQYETTSHCVILATVDNSSCHRGFIVMFTHEEAKLVMSGLMRT